MGDCLPSAEDMAANDMESDTAAVADIIGNHTFRLQFVKYIQQRLWLRLKCMTENVG